MRKVTLCEFPAFGMPRETKMSLSSAKELYKLKREGLKKFHPLVEEMSFLGIKDEKGKWIVTNERKIKKVV